MIHVPPPTWSLKDLLFLSFLHPPPPLSPSSVFNANVFKKACPRGQSQCCSMCGLDVTKGHVRGGVLLFVLYRQVTGFCKVVVSDQSSSKIQLVSALPSSTPPPPPSSILLDPSSSSSRYSSPFTLRSSWWDRIDDAMPLCWITCL